MSELKVALLFVLMCFIAVNSQLTFTPNWGKRDPGASLAAAAAGGSPQIIGSSSMYAGGDSNCKTSMDSMLVIYRLIQNEAQRIISCSGK